MSSSKDRVEPSDALKLELRQAAGFGCVICGSPVFDYEHIDGYWVTGNDPKFMTVLCPHHHREKTAGRLPVDLVRQRAKDPVNRRRSKGNPHELFVEGKVLTWQLGDLKMQAQPSETLAAITVDDVMILGARLSFGRLLLSAIFQDESNRKILQIKDGQLVLYPHAAWDFSFTGQVLKIRQGPRKVLLELKLVPEENTVKVLTGHFYRNGYSIRVGRAATNGGVEVGGLKPSAGASFSLSGGGSMIGGGLEMGIRNERYTTLMRVPDRRDPTWAPRFPAAPRHIPDTFRSLGIWRWEPGFWSPLRNPLGYKLVD